MDEKVDVEMSFANDAVRKYIQFATPNEESEVRALNTIFIEKKSKNLIFEPFSGFRSPNYIKQRVW